MCFVLLACMMFKMGIVIIDQRCSFFFFVILKCLHIHDIFDDLITGKEFF